jgi:RND family efflux transporter MFP subunit
MKRIRNLIIIGVGLIVVIAVAVLAGGKHGAPAVTVQKLAYGDFTIKLPESGVLQHPRAETVPSLVAGNIGEIAARAGDSVARGQLLATVYNPALSYNAAGSSADYVSQVAAVNEARVQEQNAKVNYQAQVDTNKSNYDEAKRVYDADVVLFANKAIPGNQLDADKAKFEQAKVAYDQSVENLRLGAVSGYNGSSVAAAQAAADKARIINDQNQEQLGFTKIVAPFDGTIQTVASQTNDSLRPVQAGDSVLAGQALFTIAEGNAFIVRTKVDEQDVSQVRLGMRATVGGEDFGGATFPGHVASIAPTAQKSDDSSATSKQVLTVIALDKIAGFMKDGMSADVDILTTDLHHVLVIANSSIVTKNGKKSVFVVVSGKASKRDIRVGKTSDTTSVVSGGLLPGDSVILSPSPTLVEGAPVTIATPTSSPSPSAS